MPRLAVQQIQLSRIPQALGLCGSDLPGLCFFLNEAQQRLVNAGGETGWWGGWAEVVFQVSPCHPYITLPFNFSRAINLAPCGRGIKIQNQFYETMADSIGIQSRHNSRNWCGAFAGYERNNALTMIDLTPTNQYLQVLLTNPLDAGKRVLITGLDQNGNAIYSQDGSAPVNGFYLTLQNGLVTSPMIVTQITGIQKDQTLGDILLYQLDATTTDQVLLSRYAPSEISPSYRRYYIHRLPCGCFCHTAQSPCLTKLPVAPKMIPVAAVVKYEVLPVQQSTDFLVIGCLPALKEECLAIKYGEMDVPIASGLETKRHGRAIKLLQDEQRTYMGDESIAVNLRPFGTASLRRALSAVRFG